MKQIIFKSIVFFFLVCIISNGQTKKTSFYIEENDNLNVALNGKVKTLKVKKEDLMHNANTDSITYFFNKKGDAETIIAYELGLDVLNRRMRVEEVHYTFKEKKLTSKLNKMEFGIDGDIYEYDDRWNLINLKNYFNNVLVKECLFKYDSKNRKTESISYLYGGFSNYNEKTQENKSNFLYETEKYEFNADDKVVLKTVSNSRDKNSEIREYKYDERGNLIEEGNCVFFSNGTCNPKPLFGYEYNPKNQLTKKYQFAKFSPHNTDECHFYDEKGNEIESKGMYVYTDKPPFLGYHYIFEYDQFGNKIKEEELIGSYRRLGLEEYKIKTNAYDRFNNMILEEYITAQGSTIKVVKQKYIYDKKGNWVRREKEEGKDKSNLKVVEICTREISYYR